MADNGEAGIEAESSSIETESSSMKTEAPSTRPAPEMKSFADTMGSNDPEIRDVWICNDGIHHDTCIPGVPKVFEASVLEGRALYVLGVLPNWQLPAFQAIFKDCGRIVQCPNLIDIDAEGVFRWVVMSTAEEAEYVLKHINGMSLAGRVLRVCRALPPGASLVFHQGLSIENFIMNWEVNLLNLESKPSTPTPPPSAKSPALTIQPPTPQASHAHPQPTAATEPQARRLTPVSEGSNLSRSSSPAKHGTTDGFMPQTVTWANVVKAAKEEQGDFSIKPHLGKLPGSAPRLNPVGRIPNVNNTRPAESMAEQMRVVFLLNVPDSLTVADISHAVREGSLHSIRFGIDQLESKRYAGLIFQHARDAEAFFLVVTRERINNKPDRFRFLVEAARGDVFPSDDIIKLMSAPTFASRRLTIVKSRFFFVYKEDEFRRLAEKTVGKDNVQFVYVYNGGNASIIFADVHSSILFKQELERLAKGSEDESSFAGIVVSYSKDPSATPDGNFYAGMYN